MKPAMKLANTTRTFGRSWGSKHQKEPPDSARGPAAPRLRPGPGPGASRPPPSWRAKSKTSGNPRSRVSFLCVQRPYGSVGHPKTEGVDFPSGFGVPALKFSVKGTYDGVMVCFRSCSKTVLRKSRNCASASKMALLRKLCFRNQLGLACFNSMCSFLRNSFFG